MTLLEGKIRHKPICEGLGDRLYCGYGRMYLERASEQTSEIPPLTDTQVAALDLFDELANDPALHLIMRLEPGDMQFVYNHALLHDRRGFEDWPDPERRRHLLRLWLTVPGDRPLPDCFVQRFGTTTIGDRGGIQVPGTRLSAPIDG